MHFVSKRESGFIIFFPGLFHIRGMDMKRSYQTKAQRKSEKEEKKGKNWKNMKNMKMQLMTTREANSLT